MPERRIVQGQRVAEGKVIAARALRRRMTDAEGILWQALRRNRLNGLHFRRQQVIDGLIADFYCHAAGLITELDGPPHEDHVEADADRDRILAGHGLHVLRIPNDSVTRNLPAVLARIAATAQSLLEHQAQPPA